jgi:tetratricopeptide (TPR) repeat protein
MANLIEKHPVPLILKKILNDRLSGELAVTCEDWSKSLFFLEGDLEYASSTLIEDRLGEMLLAKGKIDKEQLVMLRRMREISPNKFGKLLVDHKLLTRTELFAALKEQIKQIAVSLFSLTSGEWSFTSKIPESTGSQKFGVHLPEVIIEGCKRIPDFFYYQRRFEFRAPVTLPIPEEIGQKLGSDEIKFYVKLTKCQTASSKQIIALLQFPADRFWRWVALFYMLNIIDFTEFRVDEELNEQIEMINDLHEKLTSQSIDHYELLDLKNTESVTEVKEKYFSFTKKFRLGEVLAPPDSRTMEKTDFIIRQATQAFETLSNEDKKKAYDTGQFLTKGFKEQEEQKEKEEKEEKEEKKRPKEDHKANIKKARNFYLKAHSLYEEKRFQEAARLLEDAVILDNNRSSYFLLLGLSQTRIPSQRPYAEKNLQKVKDMEPWNADPLFYLGQLYWAENLVKKAEKCFRQALEINMEHTLAAKMIKKIEVKKKGKPLFSVFAKKEK